MALGKEASARLLILGGRGGQLGLDWAMPIPYLLDLNSMTWSMPLTAGPVQPPPGLMRYEPEH